MRKSDLPGLRVIDRESLGLATVTARKDQRAFLAQHVRERLGIELPQGPYRTVADDLAIAGIRPDTWLACHERASYDLARSLREVLGNAGAVADQSDAYVVLRLTGANVRDTLCKLVPIDLHPRVFKLGNVAVTAGAYIEATLWRLENEADGTATFEIAVPRSFARSFRLALTECAAEFGIKELRG